MNHYKKALEEGDKLFDDRFLDGKGEMFGRLVPCVWNSKSEIKSYLTSFAEKIRQAVAEDVAEWAEGKAEQQRTEGCPGQCVRDTLDDLRNFLSDLPIKENN